MRVDLGPVSPESAQAWISYATDTLGVLRGLPEEQLSSRALDAFASLLPRDDPEGRAEHESDADAQFVEQMRNVWGIARRD